MRDQEVLPKRIIWLQGGIASSPFTVHGRREAGFLLRTVQMGEMLSLPHSRPMPGISNRCHELRVPDEYNSWRIVYRIDSDFIVVLEIFSKKDRTTPQNVVDRCKSSIRSNDSE